MLWKKAFSLHENTHVDSTGQTRAWGSSNKLEEERILSDDSTDEWQLYIILRPITIK